MESVIVHDKEFVKFIDAQKIDATVTTLAERINKDMKGKNPLFLVVLNGAFIFAADLFKKLTIPCEISFVKLSSYIGTQSNHVVRELIGLDELVTYRTVVILEDIIDTGLTMGVTTEKLRKLEAKEVKIATLLFKPDAFQMSYEIDYVGMTIPNDFIIGYGLDYNRHGRNLPHIYKISE